ncbi:MAG: polysaccharide biosynthesis C-terminal domain-containing protein, partial [Candidatus Aenigmarchaeota archaeon]|nr:polysaccharide biosynthesis C-terminal domain-containing protein [Candidatus Aenigmarchaeota archaeon]
FSLVEIVRSLIVFLLVISNPGPDIVAIAVAYFAASMAIQVLMTLYIKRCISSLKGAEKRSKDTPKRIILFGSLIFFGSISTFIIGYGDTIVLTYFRPLYEVGLYQAAVSTSQFLLIFSGSISVVLFPLVSEVWAHGKKDEIKRHAEFMIKAVFFFMGFASLLFISFPEIVMNVLFGKNYIGSSTPFQILSFGMIFLSINAILSVMLNAIGQPKRNTKAIIIISVYNIIANIILVPLFGIEGAAISTFSSYILGFFILYRYLKKSINVSIPFRHIFIILANSFISILIVYSIKQVLSLNIFIEAAICILSALIFYTLFFLKVKIFTKDDMKIIHSSDIFPVKLRNLMSKFSE